MANIESDTVPVFSSSNQTTHLQQIMTLLTQRPDALSADERIYLYSSAPAESDTAVPVSVKFATDSPSESPESVSVSVSVSPVVKFATESTESTATESTATESTKSTATESTESTEPIETLATPAETHDRYVRYNGTYNELVRSAGVNGSCNGIDMVSADTSLVDKKIEEKNAEKKFHQDNRIKQVKLLASYKEALVNAFTSLSAAHNSTPVMDRIEPLDIDKTGLDQETIDLLSDIDTSIIAATGTLEERVNRAKANVLSVRSDIAALVTQMKQTTADMKEIDSQIMLLNIEQTNQGNAPHMAVLSSEELLNEYMWNCVNPDEVNDEFNP